MRMTLQAKMRTKYAFQETLCRQVARRYSPINEGRENIAKNRKEPEALRARANEQSTKERLQCKDALKRYRNHENRS